MDQMDGSNNRVANSQNRAYERQTLIAKWQGILNSGNFPLQSSFLTVSKNREDFGVLNMPAEFVDRFGPMLPSWIGLSCNNILWVVNYDLQKRQIYGIGKFVRFYRLRIFNMAQLDYCGEGLFVVTLFNDTALETNYPVGNPHNLVMDKAWEEQNRNDYVVRTGTFQLERCQTSILFNGCSNKDGFASMLIMESDIGMDGEIMALKSSWKEFYDAWTDGCYVSLKFADKSWEIQINKTDESCSFGKGWRVFHEEVGLKEGDYIVAFRERGKGNQQLELCIYRGEDHIYNFETVMEELKPWSKSFFKIIYEKAASTGYLMVPFIVDELYGWKLRQIKKISIGGVESRFYYLAFPGYIYMLQDSFKYLRVKENDTLIFKLNESKTISCRIYDANGMEIDYVYRRGRNTDASAGSWIWSFDAETATGQVDSLSNTTQEGHVIEDAAVNEDSFTAKLTSGNLDKKTHGLFIPEALKPANGRWMRSQKFNFITDKGLWKIGISLTANKPRFSAGWNSFVRGNKYTPGQHLHFRMVEQEGLIEFHISKI